jgi:hypothetical protein
VFFSPWLMHQPTSTPPVPRPGAAVAVSTAPVRWRRAEPDTTWSAPSAACVSVTLAAMATTSDVRLFLLCYRADGTLLEARPLFRLRPDVHRAEAEVALRPLTTRFRVALHATAPDSQVEVTLNQLALKVMRPVYA